MMAFPPRWCCFPQQFNTSLITQAKIQAPLKKNKEASADKSTRPQLKPPQCGCARLAPRHGWPVLPIASTRPVLVPWQGACSPSQGRDALPERRAGTWGLPAQGLSPLGSVPSGGGTATGPI